MILKPKYEMGFIDEDPEMTVNYYDECFPKCEYYRLVNTYSIDTFHVNDPRTAIWRERLRLARPRPNDNIIDLDEVEHDWSGYHMSLEKRDFHVFNNVGFLECKMCGWVPNGS